MNGVTRLLVLCAVLVLSLLSSSLFISHSSVGGGSTLTEDDFSGIGGQNFSFLSFSLLDSPDWDQVLTRYAAFHRKVLSTQPDNARYLLSAPSWTQVGLANNLEAMTLSLFVGIVTDRVVLYRHSENFAAVFQTDGILSQMVGAEPLVPSRLRGHYRSLSYKDLDYLALQSHFRSGKSGRKFQPNVDVLLDVAPDACGFPYAVLYNREHYARLLARLGEWRRPFSRFLFKFRPKVLEKVDNWLDTLPSAPLVALQLRFNGIWTPRGDFGLKAGVCLCGLLERGPQLHNATVVLITDQKGKLPRRALLRLVQDQCSSKSASSSMTASSFQIQVSPAAPAHVVDDNDGNVAWLWAAFDLALLSRATLGVVTPGSSFGYVGLFMGNGSVFLLDPDYVSKKQCNPRNKAFLANPMTYRTDPWWNPSYDRVAHCSMHDPSFTRKKQRVISGLCGAEDCPLCSCITPDWPTKNSRDSRFPPSVHE